MKKILLTVALATSFTFASEMTDYLKKEFMGGCTDNGNTPVSHQKLCECTWDKFEKKYSEKELTKINALTENDPQFVEITTFAQKSFMDCTEGK